MAKHFHLSTIAAAATAAYCVLAQHASAQQSAEVVTITGKTAAVHGIAGFGDATLARSPLQASVYNREALLDANVAAIADLTRLDASVADAYNAEGYWSFLTVRGFVIDNRANYRRDGLPINAETFISLANKERVEVLKGTSGIQAGTSAPGGLVNLVVKRPQGRVRHVDLEWQQDGTLDAQIDLGDRAGSDDRIGWRINVQAAKLKPQTRAADGRSHLFALATDWQITPDARLEFEIERSHRAQPSVPGQSLLGDRVPSARSIDPRVNLNNQPWSQPVVLDGNTASLRWQQRLGANWQLTAHGATQRLKSDDRVAFPFGCYDATHDIYYADRYCPDGSADLYDFRSDNERRRVDALDVHIDGTLRSGSVMHRLTAGVLRTRTRDRLQGQAFNFSGTGRIDGSVVTPAAPDLNDVNTNRDESSSEWYVRDLTKLTSSLELWSGLRGTRLQRSSVRTDGTRPTAYAQSFATPWLALSWAAGSNTIAYLSWGEGVETEVVPKRTRYRNAGEPLPALKSRQFEIGVKRDDAVLPWSLTAFDITRPVSEDLQCTDVGTDQERCTRGIDGNARHRGIEATLGWRNGALLTQFSSLWLDARRHGASDTNLNGLRPTNVAASSQRLLLTYDVSRITGLSLQANVIHESDRMAVPDNSLSVPAWTRLDLGLRYRHHLPGAALTWRLGVQNATDHRAWRESPYQFGHAYLFPLAPRTWHASLQADL